MPLLFQRSMIGTGDAFPSDAATVVWSQSNSFLTYIPIQSVNGVQPYADGITAQNNDPITGSTGGGGYAHWILLKAGTYTITFLWAEAYSGSRPSSVTATVQYGKNATGPGTGPGDVAITANWSATDSTSVTGSSWIYNFEDYVNDEILTFTHTDTDKGLTCRIDTGNQNTKRCAISIQRTS